MSDSSPLEFHLCRLFDLTWTRCDCCHVLPCLLLPILVENVLCASFTFIANQFCFHKLKLQYFNIFDNDSHNLRSIQTQYCVMRYRQVTSTVQSCSTVAHVTVSKCRHCNVRLWTCLSVYTSSQLLLVNWINTERKSTQMYILLPYNVRSYHVYDQ